jgi:hypothetical protein
MTIQPGTNKIGHAFKEGRKKYVRGVYDFATHGGAVGDITLTTTPVIPSGALVTEAIVKVNTVPTSGGAATVALKLEAAADLNAADAISGAPWSSTGVKRADKLGAADAGILTTAARSVVATVGTAALTAGAFDVVVEYMELAP